MKRIFRNAAQQQNFDEDFVRAWQGAASFQAVTRAVPGMTPKNIAIKAVKMRKKGVRLKKFAGGAQPDYKRLGILADKLARLTTPLPGA